MFKVGQKVRVVINEYATNRFKIGQICRITEVEHSHGMVRIDYQQEWYAFGRFKVIRQLEERT